MERYAAQRSSYRLSSGGGAARAGLDPHLAPASRPAERLPWPMAMRVIAILALAGWVAAGVGVVMVLRWLVG
jgi:hypothetical protein